MSQMRFDQYLMADHRACDAELGALRRHAVTGDWNAAHESLAALCRSVLGHFAAEEEQLFPAFEAASGMTCGPTQVMRMEHEEARLLLEDLADAVSDNSLEGVRGYGEALLILLQQHNMKEENILYPAAVDALSAQLGDISERVISRREQA